MFEDQGLGFEVYGLICWVLWSACRAQGLWFKVVGLGFDVWSVGFRV